MIPFTSQTEFNNNGRLKIISNINIFNLARTFKTGIQNEIVTQLTQEEKYDIQYSKYNENVVNKLVILGAQKFAGYNSIEALYCAAMSVGTIIKEYGWGIQFVTGNGCYEMARRIYDATKLI